MSTPTEIIEQFMTTFIDAWPSADATGLARFFALDATYHNGPLEPAHGREGIVAALAQMMTMGGEVEVDIVHLLAEGPIVMTERIDYWRLGDATGSLRVAGVFEVENDVITAWRDYFDPNEFGRSMSQIGDS
jgi:limonene-1,2-epoxide hydrolase